MGFFEIDTELSKLNNVEYEYHKKNYKGLLISNTIRGHCRLITNNICGCRNFVHINGEFYLNLYYREMLITVIQLTNFMLSNGQFITLIMPMVRK